MTLKHLPLYLLFYAAICGRSYSCTHTPLVTDWYLDSAQCQVPSLKLDLFFSAELAPPTLNVLLAGWPDNYIT